MASRRWIYRKKLRLQHSNIDEDEILECGTEKELKELVYNIAQEDFNQGIYYCVNDMDEIIKYWKENKEEK